MLAIKSAVDVVATKPFGEFRLVLTVFRACLVDCCTGGSTHRNRRSEASPLGCGSAHWSPPWPDLPQLRVAVALHGISFEDASQVVLDPLHKTRQDRIEGGECRWQTIG